MALKNPKKMTDYSSGTPAVRILLLYRFLIENTNKENVVKREDIFKYLEAHEIEPSKNTFYADMDFLRNAGIDIVYNEKKQGYQVLNAPFEPSEVRLIVDSIQASKFLTQKRADELSQKVKETLTDRHTRADLNRQAFVAGRSRSMNESVIKDTDKIYAAIAADSKIRFRYFHIEPNSSKTRKYSKATNGEYIVSPYALYWDRGYLYLYAYTDKKDFRYFRVDRMDTIKGPLGIERDGKDEYKESNITRRKAKIFNMYGGKTYDVRMSFSNYLASSVIDEFGDNIVMIPDDEGKTFTFSAAVQVSPTFFSWIATFGKSAKILGPAEVVDKMKDFIEKLQEMYKDD